MARPVTLFTGQWADLPLEDMCRKASDFGYKGIELACWGDHFEVDKAIADELLPRPSATCWTATTCSATRSARTSSARRCAIGSTSGTRRSCRRTCGATASRPASTPRGRGDEEHGPRRAAARRRRGQRLHRLEHLALLYSFPPVPESMIDAGFQQFAERWNPILDVFGECGVRFALEVHPTEIAFDIVTARRALEALGNREEFGFNFDPSHLLWQGVDPVEFIREFPDRIYHVHIKDAIVTLNGRSGILASHLNFGDPRRGWDFRSPGRGGVNFEEIIRALNQVEVRRPAVGRMGRQRHGPRARRPRGVRVREEARLRAERRGVRRGVCGELDADWSLKRSAPHCAFSTDWSLQ